MIKHNRTCSSAPAALILRALLLRALLCCAFLACPLAAGADPVKIGFLSTFSGPAAALGQDEWDGFMLAVDERAGQLGGAPVKVIKQDDQLKPDVGVERLQQLLTAEKVDMVTGVNFSNVLMAIAKPLAASGVPFVGSNAGPAPLAGAQCASNFFFTSFQNDNQAEVLGRFAMDRGLKSVLLLAPNYQSGKDQVVGFKRYYQGRIAGEIYTQLNQLDFSAELAQIQAAAPEALFVFMPGGMGINFIKQMHQAGLISKMAVLSVNTVDGTQLPAIKDAALGLYAGSAWGPDLPGAVNAAFVANFEKKYGRIPSQYAAQSYDAALLIDSALRRVKGDAANRAALIAALKKADFKGTRSPFGFNTNGFPIQDQHVFEVARDARGRISLKTIATPLPALHDAYAKECPLK